MKILHFLKIYELILKDSYEGKVGERARSSSCCSLLKWQQVWGQSSTETRSLESHLCSRDPDIWVIICCFPTHMNWQLIQIGSSMIQIWHYDMEQSLCNQQLNALWPNGIWPWYIPVSEITWKYNQRINFLWRKKFSESCVSVTFKAFMENIWKKPKFQYYLQQNKLIM